MCVNEFSLCLCMYVRTCVCLCALPMNVRVSSKEQCNSYIFLNAFFVHNVLTFRCIPVL